MKKSTSFLLLSVAFIIFSCQKNTKDLENSTSSTIKRSVLSSPTDVTSSFYDLLDYPVNIIVKENNSGRKYLTYNNISAEAMPFQNATADSTQKFYLRILPSGSLDIYCFSLNRRTPAEASIVPMWVKGRNNVAEPFPYINGTFTRPDYGWRILQGGTVHNGAYILQNVQSDSVIGVTLNTNKTYMAPYTNIGRQEFEIRPVDDFEIVNIEYINDAFATISQQPDFVTQWFYSNNTSIQQSMSTAFANRASNTSNFSQTTGGSISIGGSVGFKVGVPVANVNVTINTNTTLNHSATYGKSETMEHSQTYNFPINVAPRTSVTATATVGRFLINLKYKATLRGTETGRLVTVNGIWEGISCTDVKVALVEKSLDTGETLRSTTLSKVPKTIFKF